MSVSAEERSEQARVAALTRVAQPGYNGQKATRAAFEARMRRYLAEADPENQLPVAEREQKAVALLKLDMARVRLHRLQARRRRLGLPMDVEPEETT